MIVGVGVDILELKKLQSILDFVGQRFLNKVYTKPELRYIRDETNLSHLATTFAGKEAVFKTLGSLGIDIVDWREIEILRKKNGKPFVRFRGKLKNQVSKQGSFSILISMTATSDLAIGLAILKQNE